MPYISKETINKIEDLDLIQTIGEFVDLKKVGNTYIGFSPFNSEMTPSFYVNPGKNLWKDFSSGKGGNTPISFLMENSGYTYPEAIEYLAGKNSIPLNYEDKTESEEYLKKKSREIKLVRISELITDKLHDLFTSLPLDHPAKNEIYTNRRYDNSIVNDYKIGYAPGGSFIYDICNKNGSLSEADELGYINIKTKNDKWSHRVIYPMVVKKGIRFITVGISGRNLNDSDKYAKWMNSTNSELFQKEEFLYGLDRAENEIKQRKEVWIVEGYNDVIAWQTHGIHNTVGICGTSITDKHIEKLKMLCEKVVFCLDSDSAGRKALIKYIPVFLKKGFRVQLINLYPDLDPDEFTRYWSIGDKKPRLSDLHTWKEIREEGFKFLMDDKFSGKDKIEVANEVKNLSQLIACIGDKPMQDIYTEWLAKESRSGKTDVKNYIKEYISSNKNRPKKTDVGFYNIPNSVKEPLETLIPIIEKYQLFISNNQIWIQDKKGPPYSFSSVSNFSIEIIQHMNDEKTPMKLIRLSNTRGDDRIFDILSQEINSLQSFENMVTSHGNFRWKGNRQELELLKTYLFDHMGVGRRIETLGWQPEGFWVWNNEISLLDSRVIKIDKNGVFKFEDSSFYVPSANNIYKSNIYKFEAQKKLLHYECGYSFLDYSKQVLKVHRNHGMTALLFTVSSIFQDIVVKELGMFPMLFFFGPPASGKDQLANVCQSFFGLPQTAINLESSVSTIKAQVREFAQFSNLISHLSEYKNGDPKLDGVLKGLWDRRGYKRGNMDSHVATESIPILSSVLMTGNYAPEQEALITRFVWEHMDKTSFSEEEIKEFEKLNDMTKIGISSFTHDLVSQRVIISQEFKKEHRSFKATLTNFKPNANSRIISNLSVLGAFFNILNEKIIFPFSKMDLIQHFEDMIDKQMNKLDSASILNKWWNCFLASMRGQHDDQIRVYRDFKIEGSNFYFNLTNCYNKIQRQWYNQFKDTPPALGIISERLKADQSWIKYVSSVRFAKGRKSTPTSAFVIDMNKITISSELKLAIEFQNNSDILYN